MDLLKKSLSAMAAVLFLTSAASCSSGGSSSESVTSAEPATEEPTEEVKETDISGQTITWLADYDINPAVKGQDRSVALSLFEDVYGASVKFERCEAGEKYETLSKMLLSGKTVDMFPYDQQAIPYGTAKELFAPLDEYYDVLDMDSEMWEGMSELTDSLAYNGEHYVIPYSLSSPQLLIYSRKLVQAEGLDDPAKLYAENKWDWDAFMGMMKKFKEKAPEGVTRYGINGWFGQSVLNSSGKTVISSDNGKLVSNLASPEIEKAEKLMQEIRDSGLYYRDWLGHYAKDNTILFFAAADWALGESNLVTPDADLMAVPFPKSPLAEDYALPCNIGARMLVKGSEHPEAVAAFIKCERMAATQSEYTAKAKEEALKGSVRSKLTEEQYDAIQSYLSDVMPVCDLGFGMSGKMFTAESRSYDTMGVMNKLESALLDYPDKAENWEKLRDAVKGDIDSALKEYNK